MVTTRQKHDPSQPKLKQKHHTLCVPVFVHGAHVHHSHSSCHMFLYAPSPTIHTNQRFFWSPCPYRKCLSQGLVICDWSTTCSHSHTYTIHLSYTHIYTGPSAWSYLFVPCWGCAHTHTHPFYSVCCGGVAFCGRRHKQNTHKINQRRRPNHGSANITIRTRRSQQQCALSVSSSPSSNCTSCLCWGWVAVPLPTNKAVRRVAALSVAGE